MRISDWSSDVCSSDRLVFGHVGFAINRAVRSFTLAITGSMLTRAPIDGEFAPYFRKLERMSSALAFTSDLTMGVVGGKLKFMERLSARLGDVLSQLYIASAVLKFYLEGSKSDAERAHARWALDTSLYEIGQAFDRSEEHTPELQPLMRH